MSDGDTSSEPVASANSTSRPRHALPTRRLAFPKHLDLLRGYAIAAAEQGGAVLNRQAAKLVNLSPQTTSLANGFFLESGLLERTDRGSVPAPEVVAFQHAYQWNPDGAAQALGPLLRKTWFANALLPQLRMNPQTEDDAIRTLSQAAAAGPDYRPELRLLLDYLQAGGVIVRDGGYVQAGTTLAVDPALGLNDRVEQPQDARPATREPQPEPTGTRGPLPLLIQGLLEQLPRDRRWTRPQAEKWLELARMSFEVVYDLGPDKLTE